MTIQRDLQNLREVMASAAEHKVKTPYEKNPKVNYMLNEYQFRRLNEHLDSLQENISLMQREHIMEMNNLRSQIEIEKAEEVKNELEKLKMLKRQFNIVFEDLTDEQDRTS